MYDLIITWHTFQDKEENEVMRATGITMDAVVEILKLYTCSPSLHIKIIKVIELKEAYNETESYSCIKSDKFNIRR